MKISFPLISLLCLWRWNPIVEKSDTATVVVAGDLSTRVNRNDTCYVLEWSIWVEFSCCLPALIHSLVEEGATMQDNTDAPSQSFYKCHWLPGIHCRTSTTYYVWGWRGSDVGARFAPARCWICRLMKGNSAILVNRIPSIPQGPIDGVHDE